MLKENINDEIENQDNEPVYGSATEADGTEYGIPYTPSEDEEIIHKRKVRSDTYTAISSIGINAFPIVVDIIKHRKDETPYKKAGTLRENCQKV